MKKSCDWWGKMIRPSLKKLFAVTGLTSRKGIKNKGKKMCKFRIKRLISQMAVFFFLYIGGILSESVE